ncbi:MAG TPA: 50S ribosomal protein L4 [Clostridiaceae bacterium]|jgi:large subunit ribosomal protein L4|nr:50S ribosomal protein L4 [Clostridiaceae bacterium]
MPKVNLYNIDGDVIGEIELKDEIFGVDVKQDLLHTVVLNQLANKRQGTQSTKTRSEVRGGGRKPWRQKGTGRARHGSIRSPLWIKGGVTFAPKPRSYKYKLPKKVRRQALKSALTSKVEGDNIIVLDDLSFNQIKTKQMVNVLNNLKLDSSTLIVLEGKNENVERSARNIPNIKTAFVNTINVYDILKYDKFVITKNAVQKVEEVYA